MTKPNHVRRRGSRSGLWFTAAALLVFVWLQNVAAQWGDRNWVFISISAVVLAAMALLFWLIALIAPPLSRLGISLAKSIGPAVAADPEVRRLSARFPKLEDWLERRLALDTWRGLYLTVTVLSTAYFLTTFLSIARAVAASDVITRYDVQISALLRAFRTPVLTRMLWVFTILGDARVAAGLTALATALLLTWGRRRDAVLLASAVGGAALLGAIAKHFLHRPRPDIAFALIKDPASFSLPSGHALYALCFWGVIGVLVARSTRPSWMKVAAGLLGVSMTALTGVSRVYLGVHWPSDIAASWMLGLSWLSVCLGVYLMTIRYLSVPADRPVWSRRTRMVITTLSALLAAGAVLWGAQADPVLGRLVAPGHSREWSVSKDATGGPTPTPAQAEELPRFSEQLDGTTQEPIGLIFVGTEAELTKAFVRAGWSIADRPSPTTLLHAVAASISNKPYPTAPVTPTFLDGSVQTIAFEKPEGQATVRRRHHNRWWRTNLVVRGVPVWVATASFDSRLEIGSVIRLPTHHIDPNIDAERDYVVRDLTGSGLRSTTTVRVSQPVAGNDAQGDPWFTQGMATVLVR